MYLGETVNHLHTQKTHGFYRELVLAKFKQLLQRGTQHGHCSHTEVPFLPVPNQLWEARLALKLTEHPGFVLQLALVRRDWLQFESNFFVSLERAAGVDTSEIASPNLQAYFESTHFQGFHNRYSRALSVLG